MIKVFCDMCGKNIDYSSDGVNVDFNHNSCRVSKKRIS